MMAITKLITLPDHFLKANGIERGTHVEVYPVYNREDSIRLQFEWEVTDEEDK